MFGTGPIVRIWSTGNQEPHWQADVAEGTDDLESKRDVFSRQDSGGIEKDDRICQVITDEVCHFRGERARAGEVQTVWNDGIDFGSHQFSELSCPRFRDCHISHSGLPFADQIECTIWRGFFVWVLGSKIVRPGDRLPARSG